MLLQTVLVVLALFPQESSNVVPVELVVYISWCYSDQTAQCSTIFFIYDCLLNLF